MLIRITKQRFMIGYIMNPGNVAKGSYHYHYGHHMTMTMTMK